jgi:hypothetical protein
MAGSVVFLRFAIPISYNGSLDASVCDCCNGCMVASIPVWYNVKKKIPPKLTGEMEN